MKLYSTQGNLTGMLFMYFAIGLSFTFMALAVAYATWESLGLFAIAVIGSFFFREHLSVLQLTGIGLLLGGVVVVNIAENAQNE